MLPCLCILNANTEITLSVTPRDHDKIIKLTVKLKYTICFAKQESNDCNYSLLSRILKVIFHVRNIVKLISVYFPKLTYYPVVTCNTFISFIKPLGLSVNHELAKNKSWIFAKIYGQNVFKARNISKTSFVLNWCFRAVTDVI